MLSELTLVNFKAFRSLAIEMRALTVLTGLNNSGKSSIIQALLLAEVARTSDDRVPLNGPFGLAFGEATDVLSFDAAQSKIGIGLKGPSFAEDFVLGVPMERTLSLEPVERPVTARRHIGAYLSAERLGPRDLLEVDPDTRGAMGSDESNGTLSVGHQGQYTPHVLAQYDRLQVREEMRHPGAGDGSQAAITLAAQTELWLAEIARPVRLEATWLQGTNAASLRFRGTDARAEWMRPANVGFGVSYALPVVVAALVAEPGFLLIVENPEAHLHPAGQSAIGRFLALVAATGVQTVIETHSDHVVNGIRRAVAERSTPRSEDAVILFVTDGGVDQIDVESSGSLSDWPAGFFDQGERDLSVLSRLKRENRKADGGDS